MKKLIYIVLVMAVITSCSDQTQTNVDDTFPEYDINLYCHKRAELYKKDDIDGLISFSDGIFKYCLKEEKADYEWLKSHWDLLSSKSKVLCKRAVNSSRENYRTLKGCSFAAICFEDHENLKICEDRRK